LYEEEFEDTEGVIRIR